MKKKKRKKKVKHRHKHCPGAIGLSWSTKFSFHTKVQNSDFQSVSSLGLFCSSVGLNMMFWSEWDFKLFKIYKKWYCRQVHETKGNTFFCKMFYSSAFRNFYYGCQKLLSWQSAGCLLSVPSASENTFKFHNFLRSWVLSL